MPKFITLILVLIFAGMIGIYVWVGRIGGGEQLQQDKVLAAEIQGREALKQKRPDLALTYLDKGLKALTDTPRPALRAPLLAARGDALRGLGRCPEARQAWAEACRLGQTAVCKPVCP